MWARDKRGIIMEKYIIVGHSENGVIKGSLIEVENFTEAENKSKEIYPDCSKIEIHQICKEDQ